MDDLGKKLCGGSSVQLAFARFPQASKKGLRYPLVWARPGSHSALGNGGSILALHIGGTDVYLVKYFISYASVFLKDSAEYWRLCVCVCLF